MVEQTFRLLVAIPAVHVPHEHNLPKIKKAIRKTLVGYKYDLYVGEVNDAGWQFVVNAYNRVVEKMLDEGYDYLLLLESDVLIPRNTFES